jgi:1-acyl-sn-glycerol-3-phosphate acyltransferase
MHYSVGTRMPPMLEEQTRKRNQEPITARIAARPCPLPVGLRLLSHLLRLPLFVIGTVVCGSASLLASLFERDGRHQHRIAQAWARASMRFAGARLQVIGAERLREFPVAVYTCNHLSYMDTPAIFAAIPFQFRIVARHNLWKIPFIGWHLNRSGQIPVNVSNPRASIASLSGGVKALKSGTPLFIFPEGGRTRTGEPGPFLNGPAFMAVRAQVPLVPMALIGTYELLPIDTQTFFPVPVLLAVGEPILTEGRTTRDADALTAELRERIIALYARYATACGREL